MEILKNNLRAAFNEPLRFEIEVPESITSAWLQTNGSLHECGREASLQLTGQYYTKQKHKIITSSLILVELAIWDMWCHVTCPTPVMQKMTLEKWKMLELTFFGLGFTLTLKNCGYAGLFVTKERCSFIDWFWCKRVMCYGNVSCSDVLPLRCLNLWFMKFPDCQIASRDAEVTAARCGCN